MNKKFIYFFSGSTNNYCDLCLLVYGNMNNGFVYKYVLLCRRIDYIFWTSNLCNIKWISLIFLLIACEKYSHQNT